MLKDWCAAAGSLRHPPMKPWVLQPSWRSSEIAYPEERFGDDDVVLDGGHNLAHPPCHQSSMQPLERRARSRAVT
jgi:hypothetical protein